MAILKDLYDFIANRRKHVHHTTISKILHTSGLYRRVASRRTVLRKVHLGCREVCTNTSEGVCNKLKVLWSDETKVELE